MKCDICQEWSKTPWCMGRVKLCSGKCYGEWRSRKVNELHLGKEVRRLAFELPAEVFEQLMDECMYGVVGEEGEENKPFWYLLQEYYGLIIMRGDTVICHPAFYEFIERETGGEKPPWVYGQESLRKMQCMIIAGPGRGEEMMVHLRVIERQREEAERGKQMRTEQLERLFTEEEDGGWE